MMLLHHSAVAEAAGQLLFNCRTCFHSISDPAVTAADDDDSIVNGGLYSLYLRFPTVWNSLPDDLRDPTVNSVQFRRNLKTYLFAWHLKR